jgi:hypothetical protein
MFLQKGDYQYITENRYLDLLGFSWFFLVFLGYFTAYSNSFTGVFWGLIGFSWVYLDLLQPEKG